MKGLFVIQWLDFPVGNRAFGGGGWSRNAKHRPAPEPLQQVVGFIEERGKSFIVNGARRLKLNIYDATAKQWVRRDYPELAEAFDMHAKLAKDAQDELRKMVGKAPVSLGGKRVVEL